MLDVHQIKNLAAHWGCGSSCLERMQGAHAPLSIDLHQSRLAVRFLGLILVARKRLISPAGRNAVLAISAALLLTTSEGRSLSRRRRPETYGASLLKINIKCIGALKFLRAFLPSGSIRQAARRPSGYFVPCIRPATRAAGNSQASATYAESEIEIVNERVKP